MVSCGIRQVLEGFPVAVYFGLESGQAKGNLPLCVSSLLM